MVLIPKNRMLLTTANFTYFDGEAQNSWQEQSFDVQFPAQNALDPHPGVVARTVVNVSNTKSIVFRAGEDIATNWSGWYPHAIVLGNMRILSHAGSNQFSDPSLQFKVECADTATGSWSLISGGYVTWYPSDAPSCLLDFLELGTYGTAVNKPFYRVTVRYPGAAAQIGAVQWGTIMLCWIYEPSRSADVGMVEEPEAVNIRIGRTTSAASVSRSHNPFRRFRVGVLLTQRTEAHKVRRMIWGGSAALRPYYRVYEERLNWIHAFVPPTDWVSDSLGAAIIGHLETTRLRSVLKDQWSWEFAFREIGGETE